MTEREKKQVNAKFWKVFHASFSSEELESMTRTTIREENIYWMMYCGMAYIAKISGNKVSVARTRG